MKTQQILTILTIGILLGSTPLSSETALAAKKANNKAISKTASQALSQQLDDQRKTQLRTLLKDEWTSRELTSGQYRMKFWDTIYGPETVPQGGRSLYISLHGGGGAPPEVNDGQWRNQKYLYQPAEGLYFVPRSPTDSWNMWHQEYMDDFLRKTIAAAVIFDSVNPDKVYILGYSAGGDGLYQMGPRMADHWAAGAMMAGHPGDSRAENLRNLPFGIYMGGQDGAYDRNSLARQYSTLLDRLGIAEGPESYVHDTHIYEDCGHWMLRRDTIAIPWMARFTRNINPRRVVWVQDDVLRSNLYWLSVPKAFERQSAMIVGEINGQTLNIERSDSPVVIVGLNEALLNLDKPVTVQFEGKTIGIRKYKRTAGSLATPLDTNPHSLGARYPVLLKIERNANAKAGATVTQL